LTRLLRDAGLRERLVAAGRETAASYAWPRKIDALEAFYTALADERADTTPVADLADSKGRSPA
jgi:hypothetical protein